MGTHFACSPLPVLPCSFFFSSLPCVQKELEATAVVGWEGISVGGQAKYDFGAAADKLTDYNGAFQYEQSDFTATIKTYA